MGRPLPPAPGRRRLHAAGQGARRPHDRRAGPPHRRGGRAPRRGPDRRPDLGQPLLRPHHPPGRPAALGPHRGRAGDLGQPGRRRHHDRAGLRRLRPQRARVPGRRRRRRRGASTPRADRRRDLGVLHRQPGVRQPAAQVQAQRHRLPRGLRTGRDQRHRHVAGPPRRRHARVQPARRRRPLRRPADGERHRRLRRRRTRPLEVLPGDRAALRRARQPGEPRPVADALPRPRARPGGLPSRAGEAGRVRPPPRRRVAHPALPGRPRRRAPSSASRASTTSVARSPSVGCRGATWSRSPASPRTTATARSAWRPTRTSCSPASPTTASTTCSQRTSSQRYSPFPGTVRAGRRRLHRQRVLPVRDRRDQGASRPVGGGDGRAASPTASGAAPGRRSATTPPSSGCTSPAAPPRAPSRRSPTSASAATPPTSATRSSRPSTSASAGASAPTPPSATGSKGRCPSTTCPTHSDGWSSATSRERRDGEAFHEWARRVPSPELRVALRGEADDGGGAPAPADLDEGEASPMTISPPESRTSWGASTAQRLPSAFRLRTEMNGITEAPGKVWFFELAAAVIDADRCVQCGACVAACPTDSIGIGTRRPPRARQDVHRLLAVLGLLPSRRAALRVDVAARRRRRSGRRRRDAGRLGARRGAAPEVSASPAPLPTTRVRATPSAPEAAAEDWRITGADPRRGSAR